VQVTSQPQPLNPMKTRTSALIATSALAILLQLAAQAQETSSGVVDFGKFTPSTTGKEFVEVNIQTGLISMVTKLVQKHEPAVAGLLAGLKSIRVNVIGLDDENREDVVKRVQGIRAELGAKGWEQVVTVQKSKEDVAIFMKTRNSEAVEGLVVTLMEPGREAVLVNIVGDIRPEKISELADRFNIEPLKHLGPVAKK